MASVELSDYPLSIVGWVSLTMLVLMLLLLAQIARLRIRLIERTAAEQRFLETWRSLMAAAIDGEKNTLPPLAGEDEIFFLKLWNHMQESLRGNAKTRLNILALRCGMMQIAYSLLRKNDLRSQLLALTTLGHLGDRHDWKDILHLARHPDPLRSLAAARTLFQIDAEAALDELKQPLLEREDWPAAQLAVVMQESGTEKIFAALADSAVSLAKSTDPAAVARLSRLLHLLEVTPHQQVMPAIRTILATTADDEAIAQCLKFLREPGDLPLALGHIGHPNWVVRLQVANALGRAGTRDDLPRLTALMGDPVWWVRYRAAQALLVLARDDAKVLSELRTGIADRYALDMLQMAESERKWQ